jgi:DNA-binding beta-propeller fold protein YncE
MGKAAIRLPISRLLPLCDLGIMNFQSLENPSIQSSKRRLDSTSSLRLLTAIAAAMLLSNVIGALAIAQDAAVAELAYPKALTVSGETLYVVDLDLPGVWQVTDSKELYVKGSNLLRKTMNRPHCATPHPAGGILVGDSATREVYWVEKQDAEPKPLTSGYIGIPMALAVSPDGKTLFVGDAEKRATFRLPIEGGKCELVARVNARGFAFDGNGQLLAITPDAEAVQSINVETGEVKTVVGDRPYQFPNSICWVGDQGFVTDTYGKCIWRFTADGKTEKWHEGAPLERPVGISATATSLLVADPKLKQVFEFSLETKESKTRL